MRLSVIINCFNYRQFIGEAIESAINQSAPAAEIIVVDDGSTDGSPALLQERYGRDDRVKIIAKPNGGQLSALVAGVSAASGDAVAFLDADDAYTYTYLEMLNGLYASKPEVGSVYVNLEKFGTEVGLFHRNSSTRIVGTSAIRNAFLDPRYCYSPTSGISARLGFAKKALSIPTNMHEEFKVCADECLFVGLSLLGACQAVVADPLVRYRVHGQNAFHKKNVVSGERENRLRYLRGYFRTIAGLLDPTHLKSVKREFRTIEQPSWFDAVSYAYLASIQYGTISDRLSVKGSIYRRYLSQRLRLRP